jgi:glycerate kinase
MPLRVLVVPDKFKGTLTARAAAELIARGWREVRPEDQLELLPMSDGGDGFGAVLADLLHLEAQTTVTVDPAHRPREAAWWFDRGSGTAVVESAQVIGLALLPPRQFHPFELDTFGLGEVIRDVIVTGTRRCLFGIGGSATNDAGFGLAVALGWRFEDAARTNLTQWTDLAQLARITPPEPRLALPEVLVAVDVQNPLLGPIGASRVYGPQKGLRPEDFPVAEAALERLAVVVTQDLALDVAAEPGTGAAGGLGFGLRSFLNGRLESGFALFARYARLEEHIQSSDLVITGEGAIDPSTLMGKGVGEVARLSHKHKIPCLGLAGTLNPDLQKAPSLEPFSRLYGMAPHLTQSDAAQRDPHLWLPRLGALAACEHDLGR